MVAQGRPNAKGLGCICEALEEVSEEWVHRGLHSGLQHLYTASGSLCNKKVAADIKKFAQRRGVVYKSAMDQTFTSMLLSRPSTQAIADACGVRRQQVNAWASRGWAPVEHHEALAGALGQPAIVAELRRDVVAHKARIKARRAAKVAS